MKYLYLFYIGLTLLFAFSMQKALSAEPEQRLHKNLSNYELGCVEGISNFIIFNHMQSGKSQQQAFQSIQLGLKDLIASCRILKNKLPADTENFKKQQQQNEQELLKQLMNEKGLDT